MDGYTISQSTLNSIGVSVVGSALTFAMAWFWYARNVAVRKAEAIAAEHAKVMERLTELETKERLSGQVMTPIITAFQSLLVKQLTHAGKPEMDELMVKIGPPDVLTDTERARLMVMLKDRTKDMGIEITASERDAAMILPIVMQMAAEEQANFKSTNAAKDLKLITIVSVVAADSKEPRERQEKDE
jgi:hypothetical protein